MNRTSSLRPRFSPVAALASALAATLATTLAGMTAAQDVGHPGPSYGGAMGSPTSTKAESKLWYADGRWWGSLWSTSGRCHSIFRLDTSTQTWIDTDTAIDPRRNSRADCLWDGSKLYVASHQETTGPGADGHPLLLYRYTYLPLEQRFALDAGFPAQIGDSSTGTLVVDKGSNGTLWAVWMRDLRVWVARSQGDDRVWTEPILLPACTSDVTSADLCSLVPFGGNRIGVLWSDVVSDAFWFTQHLDGTPTDTWSARVAALSGPGLANDHLNLKAAADGRLFAAVRTGLDRTRMLERTAGGTWLSHLVCTTDEDWTRPIVLLDEKVRRLYCFGTHPSPEGAIHSKFTALDSPAFPAGIGTAVMQSEADPSLTDATSSKQSVSRETGLVVLASQQGSKRYWHHHDSLGGRVSAVPAAAFGASARGGHAPLAVQFVEGSTGIPTSWSWSFGDAGTSTTRHPTHVYEAPGTYSVALTASNGLGTSTRTESQWITVLAPPAGLTLTAAEDAQVRERSPDDNYGQLDQLRVRRDASSDYRAFVRFFLPDTGRQIGTAKLRLWVDDGGPDGGTVHAVPGTWNESLLTWHRAPALAAPLGSLGAVSTGTWVELDVGAAALGSGMAAFGIASASSNSIFYSSREGAHPPELVLTYVAPSAPIAAFEATPLSGSRPFTVQFFDRSRGAPTTYSWNFGDGSPSSSLRNPSHVYTELGTFDVTLTVSGTNGSDAETRVQYVHALKEIRAAGPP
jgi:PKD repeat protein